MAALVEKAIVASVMFFLLFLILFSPKKIKKVMNSNLYKIQFFTLKSLKIRASLSSEDAYKKCGSTPGRSKLMENLSHLIFSALPSLRTQDKSSSNSGLIFLQCQPY